MNEGFHGMTPEQIEDFSVSLDKVFEDNKAALASTGWDWDSPLEAVLAGIMELVKTDRDKQTHELVVNCLDGCIHHLREAAFAYYASWK